MKKVGSVPQEHGTRPNCTLCLSFLICPVRRILEPTPQLCWALAGATGLSVALPRLSAFRNCPSSTPRDSGGQSNNLQGWAPGLAPRITAGQAWDPSQASPEPSLDRSVSRAKGTATTACVPRLWRRRPRREERPASSRCVRPRSRRPALSPLNFRPSSLAEASLHRVPATGCCLAYYSKTSVGDSGYHFLKMIEIALDDPAQRERG